MKTFNIIGMNTGFLKGTITAKNFDEAEAKCLNDGIDIFDLYMIVCSDEEIISGSPYIEDII